MIRTYRQILSEAKTIRNSLERSGDNLGNLTYATTSLADIVVELLEKLEAEAKE